jgi:SMI1/KNR4 family protein SUKH-1
MGVVESASRLFELMASRNATFTRYLKPGPSESEIAEIVSSTGIHLPAETVAFYSHFNPTKGYQYSADQPTFFGGYWLLNLEDAAQECKFRRSADCYDAGREGGWFPLLQEDANFYLLDTDRKTGDGCPVVQRSEYDVEPNVMFVSLEAMFDTLFLWVQEGVLEIESGHVAGDYHGDPARVAEIAASINPGVQHWTNR